MTSIHFPVTDSAKLSRERTGPKNRRHGFTLVELLVASSVAAMIAGTAVLLLMQSAIENKRGFADATLEQEASNLQDKIIQILHGMSANEGTYYYGAAVNGYYPNIIVARGSTLDLFPREQLSFDQGTRRALYNSNFPAAGTTTLLARTNSNAVVRFLGFSPAFKPDGTVDNSLVGVLIKMDDNGSSGRIGASRSNNPACIWRSFAVRMRNY